MSLYGQTTEYLAFRCTLSSVVGRSFLEKLVSPFLECRHRDQNPGNKHWQSCLKLCAYARVRVAN